MASETASGMQIPKKWSHDLKVMPCRVCGRGMKVGIRTRKAPRCIECGIKAQEDYNTQMAQKSGPAYDEWLKRMAQKFGDGGTATPPPN